MTQRLPSARKPPQTLAAAAEITRHAAEPLTPGFASGK